MSSLDGELATTTVTSTYISRVDNGTFHSYTFSNNQWLMTDKNGLQYKFGYTSTPSTTYTWDYNNRLTQAVVGSASTTYGYDPGGQRVSMTVATTSSATTYYPSKGYNITGSTPTKHIFLPDGTMIATVVGSGTSTSVSYIHTDHLGMANVSKNDGGEVVQLVDQYPYGTFRIDEQNGFNEQRKGISGHEYDSATSLTYANSRYYNGANGKFISQDPAFVNLTHLNVQLADPQSWNSPRTTARNGLNSASGFGWKRNTVAAGNSMSGWAEILADPQAQNSYAYARNNPLKYTDPDGEFDQIAVGLGLGFVGGVVGQYVGDVIDNYQSGKTGISAFGFQGSFKENIQKYADSGSQGAVTGLGLAVLGPVGAGLGAGSYSVGRDYAQGQDIDVGNAATEGIISGLSAGVANKFTPAVRGRLPNLFTKAFWTGRHTQVESAKEAIQTGAQVFIKETREFVKSFAPGF